MACANSHRNWAGRGFLALRFDYAGQGDSAGRQDDPNAVSQWQASVAAAVSYARGTGASSVAVVGLRAGALLAASTADTLGDLRALVLWDPIISGKAYVREMTSLYRITVGADDTEDDRVSVIGGVLAAEAVDNLSGLDLTRFEPSSSTQVLAAIRPENAESPRTTRMIERSGADTIVVERQNQFVSPSSFVLSVPTYDVERISTWISDRFDVDTTVVQPQITSTAQVATTSTGEEIWETLQRRTDGSLFAITTANSSTPITAPTAIFHNTANEHRVGPARLWVESARSTAEFGVRAMRFDRTGTGDSGIVIPDENTSIVSPEARRNVLDILDTLEASPLQRIHIGMCSGAWMSAYAASRRGARSVMLFNVVNWSVNNRRPPVKKAHVDAMESDVANRLFSIAKKIRDAGRVAQQLIPYRVWLGLSYAGLANAPESMLRTLTRRGIKTTVSLAVEDMAWFEANRGEQGAARLVTTSNPPQIISTQGDHNLFHRGSRIEARRQIMISVLDAFGNRSAQTHTRDDERLEV
ncbi:pimeloyl-ACP methyl ester carboxylesterase [Rhodococcus sp. 27YEA15]|uniref:alpha/beta hydrolase n=1 Tax=Rhodococcus sp. 27YEA15 TaxID=3156259 RepID=UPI003C7E15AC